MNIVKHLVVVTTILPSVLLAGNVRGNGGGVVACRDNQGQIKKAEILDIYEARELRHMQLDFGPSSSTYLEKIKYVLEKRKQVAPVRAILWQKWADSFESEAVRLKDVELELINDSLIQVLPKGCKLEQIVIQHEPQFPEDPRYTINQDLWEALDEENKAALILHEVIYREAISYGHEDSVATRYLNSIWSSAGTPSYFASQEALNELLIKVKFAIGEWQGGSPLLYACSTDSSNIHFNMDKPFPFNPLGIYYSLYQTKKLSLRTSTGQFFTLEIGSAFDTVCSWSSEGEYKWPIAGSYKEDGTLESLYYGSYRSVTIQNQVLIPSRFGYSKPTFGKAAFVLDTSSSFKELAGIGGLRYSKEQGGLARILFNDDLKVVSCDRCRVKE